MNKRRQVAAPVGINRVKPIHNIETSASRNVPNRVHHGFMPKDYCLDRVDASTRRELGLNRLDLLAYMDGLPYFSMFRQLNRT